jgi:hypothetical protein
MPQDMITIISENGFRRQSTSAFGKGVAMDRFVLMVCFALALMAMSDAPASETPYAGQHRRAIKSLSRADLRDLEAGRGWGFAKPAEMNGYPGPVHLLELKDQLGLDGAQVSQIQAIFEHMNEMAMVKGREFIEAEQQLDVGFSSASVTPENLARLTRDAALLRGQLRAIHLRAHLRTLPILTVDQVRIYKSLRGYGADDAKAHQGHTR